MGAACSTCCGPPGRANARAVKPKDSSGGSKHRPLTPRGGSGAGSGAVRRESAAAALQLHNKQQPQAAKEHVSFLDPDAGHSDDEDDDDEELRQQELEAELETCALELQRAASFCSSAGGFSRNISKAGGRSSSLAGQQQAHHSAQQQDLLLQDAVMELTPRRAGAAADDEQHAAPATPVRRQKTPSPSRGGGRNVVRPATLLPGGEEDELLQL